MKNLLPTLKEKMKSNTDLFNSLKCDMYKIREKLDSFNQKYAFFLSDKAKQYKQNVDDEITCYMDRSEQNLNQLNNKIIELEKECRFVKSA